MVLSRAGGHCARVRFQDSHSTDSMNAGGPMYLLRARVAGDRIVTHCRWTLYSIRAAALCMLSAEQRWVVTRQWLGGERNHRARVTIWQHSKGSYSPGGGGLESTRGHEGDPWETITIFEWTSSTLTPRPIQLVALQLHRPDALRTRHVHIPASSLDHF